MWDWERISMVASQSWGTRGLEAILSRPKRNRHFLGIDPLLVASGRADVTILCVSGVCKPTSGGDPIPGKLVAYYLDGKGKHPFYRWMILFKFPKPGEYELTVTGVNAGEKPEQQRRRFFASVSSTGLTVEHPENGVDLTDEKDDFVAYGGTNQPLGTVEMKKSLGGTVPPDKTVSDPQNEEFWSAQFPQLSSGTYVLHVEDTSSSLQVDVPDLTVR